MTHERVIGLYVLDEDIIISTFLHMLETYALPQLDGNNNLTVLQVAQAPLHFAHISHNCLNNEFPRLVERERRTTNCIVPSLLILHLLFSLGLC